jgi:hypothetical protein
MSVGSARKKSRPLYDAFLICVPEWGSEANEWKAKLDLCIPSTARGSLPKKIESFCFPDLEFINADKHSLRAMCGSSQQFTFVLTQASGERTFGFCLRCLRTDMTLCPRYDIRKRVPETLCFLSSYPYFSVFQMLLKSVQIRRWLTPAAVTPLLRDAYCAELPPPASPFGVQRLRFFRPVDERLEASTNGIRCVVAHFSPTMLRYLIGAILCEYRIIFFSSSLQLLSSCIHTLLSLCYPFVWSHILVPYLPSDMLDYVCAPSPYLLGVCRSKAAAVEDMPVGEVVFVDIENGTMRATEETPNIIPLGDGGGRRSSLPTSSQHFISRLEHLYARAHSGGAKARLLVDTKQVSQCFMVYFLQIFQNYRQFLGTALRDRRRFHFDDMAFLESHAEDQALKAFLKVFVRTNTFEFFLQARHDTLNGMSPKINNRATDTLKFGIFDKMVHIIELKQGDSSYTSVKSSVDAICEGELNESVMKTAQLRELLMGLTSNKMGKMSRADALRAVASVSFEASSISKIMEILWFRMEDSKGTDWRHGYKALNVIEYLLHQGSEVVIADLLDHARVLHDFMKFRANEKSDSIKLKALNVLSGYEGDDKYRGVKMRDQAIWVYRLVNDCLLIRCLRQRLARMLSQQNGPNGVPRFPHITINYIPMAAPSFEVMAVKTRGSSFFDNIKQGVKDVRSSVKQGVKDVKSQFKGKGLATTKSRKKNERLVFSFPSFLELHHRCEHVFSGPKTHFKPFVPPRTKKVKKQKIHKHKKPHRQKDETPLAIGASSVDEDLLGLDFGAIEFREGVPLTAQTELSAPGISGDLSELSFTGPTTSSISNSFNKAHGLNDHCLSSPIIPSVPVSQLPPCPPSMSIPALDDPYGMPENNALDAFDPFSANDVSNAFKNNK